MSFYKRQKKERHRFVYSSHPHSSEMSVWQLFHATANDNYLTLRYWIVRAVPIALLLAFLTF